MTFEAPKVRKTLLRFSVRNLMILVAFSSLLLGVYRLLPSVREFFQEDPFHAFRRVDRSWDLGPSPSITVDVFAGHIEVIPSQDGQVQAEISSSATTKWGQSVADSALGSIDLECSQAGDSLRITARGASEVGVMKETRVELRVPAGVSLQLRTGRGCIYVGRDHVLGKPAHLPISAHSIRAINDSPYKLGYAQGDVVVEATAPPGPSGRPPTPTRLLLEGTGTIEIIADLAIVEARAWQGTPPYEWDDQSFEGGAEGEGVISFQGRLASGAHTLRAVHRIEMKLAGEGSLGIDAKAVGGRLEGDVFPKSSGPTADRSSWIGTTGSDPGGRLKLRVDDGSIRLMKTR